MKHVLLLIALVFACQAHGTTSGTLLLKGTVPRLLEITVNPTGLASTLPLDTSQVNSSVASINERSNSKTGYKVTITSSNSGSLVHETETSSTIPYTLKYNSNSVNLVSGQTFTYSGAGSNNNNRPVTISYTGVSHENLIEGDYSDTLTFTIAAN